MFENCFDEAMEEVSIANGTNWNNDSKIRLLARFLAQEADPLLFERFEKFLELQVLEEGLQDEEGAYWLEWVGDDGEVIQQSFSTVSELKSAMVEYLAGGTQALDVANCLSPGDQEESHLANGRLYFGLAGKM